MGLTNFDNILKFEPASGKMLHYFLIFILIFCTKFLKLGCKLSSPSLKVWRRYAMWGEAGARNDGLVAAQPAGCGERPARPSGAAG